MTRIISVAQAARIGPTIMARPPTIHFHIRSSPYLGPPNQPYPASRLWLMCPEQSGLLLLSGGPHHGERSKQSSSFIPSQRMVDAAQIASANARPEPQMIHFHMPAT